MAGSKKSLLNSLQAFPLQRAAKLALAIYAGLAVMHIAVLIGMALFDFAPTEWLWGGRMETAEQLFAFEIVSVGLLLICAAVAIIRGGPLYSIKLPGKAAGWQLAARVFAALLCVMFLLNTLGNLIASSLFEQLMSVLTILLALLNLRLALR